MNSVDKEKNQQKRTVKKPSFLRALQKSGLSFLAMTPLLLGVIGLVGFFRITIPPEIFSSFFRGTPVLDTLLGTVSGAVASGNAVVSYFLGGELLDQGVSLYAVCAFMLSWVTLGVTQLPAEVEVFGGRFTAYRNLLSLIFTVFIAVITTLTMKVLS